MTQLEVFVLEIIASLIIAHLVTGVIVPKCVRKKTAQASELNKTGKPKVIIIVKDNFSESLKKITKKI
jgi:hypothetical protein